MLQEIIAVPVGSLPGVQVIALLVLPLGITARPALPRVGVRAQVVAVPLSLPALPMAVLLIRLPAVPVGSLLKTVCG